MARSQSTRLDTDAFRRHHHPAPGYRPGPHSDSPLLVLSLIPMASNHGKGSQKSGARRAENNRIYAHPLPLVFSAPDSSSKLGFGHVLGLFGLSRTRLENPHCEGVFDPATRSVWITNERDSAILWRRGFFGKGDLSRSEPSWLARQTTARKAAGKCTLCTGLLYGLAHVLD